MLQTLEELSVLSITGIVAAIVLAAVAIYALVQWLPAPKRNTERGLADAGTEPVSASPGAVPRTDMLPNPRTVGKVRVGREGNRPSEDDIAREHMGPRGRPGEPAPAPALDESITQIPKHLDPGHTA
jgi:hypothetical protein